MSLFNSILTVVGGIQTDVGKIFLEIHDKCGNVFYNEEDTSLGMTVVQNGDLVSVQRILGANSHSDQFFDVEKKLISKVFINSIASSDEVIAYLKYADDHSKITLIVQPLFNDGDYEEFERDYLDEYKGNYFLTGEFSEDGTELTINYLTYPDHEGKQDVIPLNCQPEA